MKGNNRIKLRKNNANYTKMLPDQETLQSPMVDPYNMDLE
jgi:hypothetical protein